MTTTQNTTYHFAGHIHRINVPCGSMPLGSKVSVIEGPADPAALVAQFGETCCSHCFPAAAAIKAEAQAEAKADSCAGAGTHGWEDVRGSSKLYRSPKGQCRSCGQMVRLSSAGRMVKHAG